MSMPPPPPSTPSQPSGYPSPTTPVPQQPGPYGYGHGYSQGPSEAPPSLRRPPGVDATANVLGAIGGVVIAIVAFGILVHASAELSNRLVFARDTEVVDVLVLLVGVALLGGVVITGRAAQAAPIVAGTLLVVVGLIALFSDDFLSWVFRNYPIDRDAQGVTGWLATGFTIVVGGLMIASGIASAGGRRR